MQQMKSENNAQKNQMLIMAAIMSLFMLWISWSSPAAFFCSGVRLLSSASPRTSTPCIFCRKQDEKAAAEEALEVKPVEVNVTRKVKKPRPKKKR